MEASAKKGCHCATQDDFAPSALGRFNRCYPGASPQTFAFRAFGALLRVFTQPLRVVVLTSWDRHLGQGEPHPLPTWY